MPLCVTFWITNSNQGSFSVYEVGFWSAWQTKSKAYEKWKRAGNDWRKWVVDIFIIKKANKGKTNSFPNLYIGVHFKKILRWVLSDDITIIYSFNLKDYHHTFPSPKKNVFWLGNDQIIFLSREKGKISAPCSDAKNSSVMSCLTLPHSPELSHRIKSLMC